MLAPRASRPHMPDNGIKGPEEGRGLLPCSWTEERLRASRNYWITSLRADGRRRSMPVWGVRDGEALCLAAEEAGEVAVVGHPARYPRVGPEPGAAFGVVDPHGVPPEAWMFHLLPAYSPEVRGRVSYAEALPPGG